MQTGNANGTVAVGAISREPDGRITGLRAGSPGQVDKALADKTSLILSDEMYCWDLTLSSRKKIVLLYLTRVAVPRGREAEVRTQNVAARCGMSGSTVRKIYRELALDGFLTPLSEQHGALHYRLTFGE